MANSSRLTGTDAIDYAELNGRTLSKYMDPTEDAREGMAIDEAREVAAEDPELIYLDTDRAESVAASRLSPGDALDKYAPNGDAVGCESVDQDWDGGTTRIEFADGSAVIVDSDSVLVEYRCVSDRYEPTSGEPYVGVEEFIAMREGTSGDAPDLYEDGGSWFERGTGDRVLVPAVSPVGS